MSSDSTPDSPPPVDELFPQVYAELRRLAGGYLKQERVGHTLQPTALVHEAYVRLAGVRKIDWRSRTHFFAFAATQMRRILVEHARAAGRKKRGANPVKVEIDEAAAMTDELSIDLLAIDESLRGLARRSERQARVAELRLFAGMTMPEIAAAVGVSERTAKEDWRVARAFLAVRLRPYERDPP